MTEPVRTLKICDPCWDARNRPVDQHGCWVISTHLVTDPVDVLAALCDCPCRVDQHSDLDTIDHDHDMGVRDLTDPFNPNGY